MNAPNLKTSYLLSTILAGLMVLQSLLGLLLSDQYRDVGWIKAAWFGNDWVTLLVAAPLLATGLLRSRGGSVAGLLLWLGTLGYAVYNYAYYLLGTALNVFFLLYVVSLVLSVAALILALSSIDAAAISASFRARTPVRAVGGYLIFVGVGLTAVWVGMWGAYAFAGRPTPVETEAFKLVAALDTSVMVPVLVVGGVLLWRRRAWGYVLSALAGIQAALYLLVLTVSSLVSIDRGLVAWPGEVPVWASLGIATTVAAAVLLANAGSGAPERR